MRSLVVLWLIAGCPRPPEPVPNYAHDDPTGAVDLVEVTDARGQASEEGS